jgi:hypothetical protein
VDSELPEAMAELVELIEAIPAEVSDELAARIRIHLPGSWGRAPVPALTSGARASMPAMRPVVGPHRSSRFLLNVAKKLHGVPRSTVLNGQPATIFVNGETVVATLTLD